MRRIATISSLRILRLGEKSAQRYNKISQSKQERLLFFFSNTLSRYSEQGVERVSSSRIPSSPIRIMPLSLSVDTSSNHAISIRFSIFQEGHSPVQESRQWFYFSPNEHRQRKLGTILSTSTAISEKPILSQNGILLSL